MSFGETKELRMERHALVMGAGVVCTKYTICETLRYIYPFDFACLIVGQRAAAPLTDIYFLMS